MTAIKYKHQWALTSSTQKRSLKSQIRYGIFNQAIATCITHIQLPAQSHKCLALIAHTRAHEKQCPTRSFIRFVAGQRTPKRAKVIIYTHTKYPVRVVWDGVCRYSRSLCGRLVHYGSNHCPNSLPCFHALLLLCVFCIMWRVSTYYA